MRIKFTRFSDKKTIVIRDTTIEKCRKLLFSQNQLLNEDNYVTDFGGKRIGKMKILPDMVFVDGGTI